jgi:hypothetical protein
MLLHNFSKHLLVACLVEFSLQTGSVGLYPVQILAMLSNALSEVSHGFPEARQNHDGALKETMTISFQVLLSEPFMIIIS